MAAAVAAPANGPPLGAGPAAPKDDALADLLPSEEDLLYEEELLRNPYSLRMWLRYLDARKSAPPRRRYLLYERALNALPGSYKVRLADRHRAWHDCAAVAGRRQGGHPPTRCRRCASCARPL